uniref:NADH-ubiquinone oxidoreductase chain 4 n=1 Tax=Rhabditophanes sp. KR3021 TaxID=114890 RepID=A0AC35UIJ7_9BILA
QGLFFILDSYNFVILIFIRIFIFGLIYLREKNTNLLRLTQILIFICVIFFIPRNIISLYIFFELSIFPILIILLGYGSQIEKINSSYYLLFYAAFCSFPFLFVYLNLDFSFLMVYFDSAFSCIFQRDAKALAAYSSITHIRFLLFSLLFINLTGKTRRLIIIVAHGYTSTLIFYFIGEFYHIRSSRILYFLNSFINSRILIRTFFALAFLSNRGVPPSLSFVAEFITIRRGRILLPLRFYLIFIYFFVAFYYSLYIIVISFIGKSFINFNN